jgi:putative nucleotidyltransferase with HDIG domain
MSSPKPATDFQNAVAQKIHQDRLRILNPAGRYLDGVANLPAAPMLVSQLLAHFENPHCDIDQIVQLINYEPSLMAQILRSSNSAFFAGEQPPGDIFEAVSRLGFYQVYCLVVSLVGASTKTMEGADKGVNVDELWRHSVAVAVSASTAAEGTQETKAVAFTAGLLHDIGKLVLAVIEGERYARLIQRAKDERSLLNVLERSIFVIDHAEVGGELMRRWNLPPDVVTAVRYHHELADAPSHRRLTAAVQVGDMMAHQLFGEDLASTDLLAPSTAALDVLKLTPEDLPRLLAKAQAELENVKGMLEL